MRRHRLAVLLVAGLVLTAAFTLGQRHRARAEQVSITGKVLLPDGQPAAGATVRGVTAGTFMRQLPAVTTGPEGGFTLSADLAKGGEVGLVALKPGYVPAGARLQQVGPVVLRLGGNPATYHGRVCDPEGKPLTGARIGLEAISVGGVGEEIDLTLESLGQAVSGAEGTFALPDLPPESVLMLTATAPGRATTSALRHVGGATLPIVLRAGAVVTGRVTWKGQPVVGVHVEAYGGGTRSAAVVTDAQGGYRLEQISGKNVYVQITDPPAGALSSGRSLAALAPGQPLTGQDFVILGAATIQGKVTEGGTGRGLEGVMVTAQGQGPHLRPGVSAGAWTGADGAYELRTAAGHLRLLAAARPDFTVMEEPRRWTAAPPSREIDVAEGQTVPGQDFVMTPPPPHPPAPRVQGHVFRPDGTPAAGVEVGSFLGMGPGQPDHTHLTDAQGAFSVDFASPEGPPADFGDRFLLARDMATGLLGGAWVKGAVTGLRLTLAPGAYILTGALDRQGRPSPDVEIYASVIELPWTGADAQVADARTDQQGRVRLGPLPPGYPLQLSRRGDDGNYSAGPQWGEKPEPALQPGEERTVPHTVVNRWRGQISGSVVDAQGLPVAGAFVYAKDTNDAAETDQQGRFTITGVHVRGTVWLLAFDPFQPLFALREVDPNKEPAPRLVLRPLGGARGRVVDEQGRPLAQVRVWVRKSEVPPVAGPADMTFAAPHPLEFGQEANQRAEAAGIGGSRAWDAQVSTDAQGNWQVGGLLAGAAYGVSLSRDHGYGRPPVTFTTPAGATKDLGKLVLPPVRK